MCGGVNTVVWEHARRDQTAHVTADGPRARERESQPFAFTMRWLNTSSLLLYLLPLPVQTSDAAFLPEVREFIAVPSSAAAVAGMQAATFVRTLAVVLVDLQRRRRVLEYARRSSTRRGGSKATRGVPKALTYPCEAPGLRQG